MPKMEVTDEVKADLKAIKFRNMIFPKRFYKENDSKSLPTFFQIGKVVDDKPGMFSKDRLTKKQQKKSIAQQFMLDDSSVGFSKRKYEKVNDRRRRMGEKKKQVNISKKRTKQAGKFKSKWLDHYHYCF